MSTAGMSSKSPRRGDHIVVYDAKQIELGEGTFKEKSFMGQITVYECQEHTMLARGTHWIRINGVLHNVQLEGDKL